MLLKYMVIRMNKKEHKKIAIEEMKKKDQNHVSETLDIKTIIEKIIQLKAVETGAIAPDQIEYKLGIKHRGFLHSQFLLEKIENYLENNVNNSDPIFQFVIKPFLIGYTSHLKEDKKTKMGIPITY